MKRHLTILSAAAAVVIALTVSGCGGSAAGDVTGGTGAPGANEVKELRYQGWANNVTLPELAEDLGYLGDVKLNWVGNTISGPQDIQSAATGQTDFGGAFAGAVVKLVEAGAPVKAVINYYGEDSKSFNGFYVKEDSPIKTARDFIGKKVAVNTLGAHSEAVINTYLRKNGLSADEIKQVQLVVVPPNDTEEAIRRGQVDAGSLGSILQDRAVANGGLRSVFSDFDLFGTFAGGPYVFREDFLAQNPNRPDLHHGCGEGHRVGTGHAPQGSDCPAHQDPEGTRPQREPGRPAVLEERRCPRQGRNQGRGFHPLGGIPEVRGHHPVRPGHQEAVHQRVQRSPDEVIHRSDTTVRKKT
ncbi:ABC transporter substrate-binding protein [Arthrobacter sp. FW305-BF8]|uniref:ABC transporter substrate-binding protein n=1 Tax=Arthrobacter sp. FW305-BF8 TaxID=2879617 RepID=UPI001F3B9C7C|nr:ABC transporter substrate-binding protein [Arthrobacter sp. FW305-BF8]UKA53257.1 ABC transporter substrate-binding protein [Arthrobacter sp. FW305-BF8]